MPCLTSSKKQKKHPSNFKKRGCPARVIPARVFSARVFPARVFPAQVQPVLLFSPCSKF